MRTELQSAFAANRGAFVATALFSLFTNLLLFASPLYMLQVYDRVLASRSESTLVMLTIIVGAMLLVLALLETARSRVLLRAGAHFDELLSRRVFAAVFERSLRLPGGNPGQSLRDLDGVRDFFTGPGILAFFDAPWAPLFIVAAFVLHPVLGLVTLGGVVAILALAGANELVTRRQVKAASTEAVTAGAFAETSLKNAEAIAAMGMLPGLAGRWLARHRKVMALQAGAGERGGNLMALSRFLRLFLQSAVLGIGAWLAIHDEVSGGAIIAGSIILGRALAPVELAVGQWRGFLNARAAYARLQELLRAVPAAPDAMPLPKPSGAVAVEHAVALPPGGKAPVLKGVSFALAPGEVLGVVGPSAAGKSTLARVLVGVWPLASGSVRLDGAELKQWSRERLGPHIGYLPQDVELFDGTVAENIARFGDIDPDAVVEAAAKAGVHDMIVHLAEGYDTRIGVDGHALSGGQRQRLGLARALYGDPALVVLDEPNSNLDSPGEQALLGAMAELRQRGATTVVITHRLNILGSVDKILVLRDGQVELFGTRDEVMAKLARPTVIAGGQPPAVAVSHQPMKVTQ